MCEARGVRVDGACEQVAGGALELVGGEQVADMEIVKHRDWAQTDARIHHYRDGRDEIDLVLENRSGEIAAIEVKAGATLAARDWRALAKLRDRVGARFRAGVVIHSGRQTLPLGDRLWAIPLSGLWA